MGAGVIGEVVFGLVKGLLAAVQAYMQRRDIQKGELQRIALEAAGMERAALEWTALALRDPARAAELRVQHPDLLLSGFVPDPPAGPPGPAPKGHV